MTIEEWTLIVTAVVGLSGWFGFFMQYQSHKRLLTDDQVQWNDAFVRYRRSYLKPLTNTVRDAYGKYRDGKLDYPETWEGLIHAATWPRGLPMQRNQRLASWRVSIGVGLDSEDDRLMIFCEAIYPPFDPNDKRPIRERSIMSPTEFDKFDQARGGISDYFDLCGDLRHQSRRFGEFLEEKVRPNHYYKVKFVSYLELALVRVWGSSSETYGAKDGLLELGKLWSTDDPRAH